MSSYLVRHFVDRHTPEGHQGFISRFRTGRSPIGRGSPLYGTRVRCQCGWTGASNEAPTKGGIRDCRAAWTEHINAIQAIASNS